MKRSTLPLTGAGDGNIAYDGFDYESNFVELSDGLKMHYLDEGAGDPVVMLHGLPTQAYLWRNVIPYVSNTNRVVVLDHLNFGLSDKTEPLTPKQHSERFAQFVDGLGLEDINLVLHDWGVGIGLMYAANHPDNVASITFFEGPFGPFPSIDSAPAGFIQAIAGPDSERNIIENNFFIECWLLDPDCGGATTHECSEAEKTVYRAPVVNVEDRQQILLLPRYLPFLDTTGHPTWDTGGEGGDPATPVPDIEEFVKYAQYLQTDEVPKLFITGVPGLLPDGDQVAQELQSSYANLQTATVGSVENPVKHYIPEDAPDELGQAISDFLDQLSGRRQGGTQ